MPGISHIGIVVRDLDKAIDTYAMLLGCRPDFVGEVADQKVRVAMFHPSGAGQSAIELICPFEDNASINKFLEKHGEGMHHLTLKVTDIEARLKELKSAGYRLIDEIPRIGAEGGKIAFVHPESTAGVLLELEQE
jgi:methylmalonyl-CoA/ethylmalonyl-CoA epimerase